MSSPSMAEAAKIRNVADRHSYVFDNGLSSHDFFDLAHRMTSEEFLILRNRIARTDSVLEIGCFTGLNLLGLALTGNDRLYGVDFVQGAVKWLQEQSRRAGSPINAWVGEFPDSFHLGRFDWVICFDVLEHQRNPGRFLEAVRERINANGRVLFLVPKGREFYDCGHVAFFPDLECLHNVLDYVFVVDELFELKACRKLFASCRLRTE